MTIEEFISENALEAEVEPASENPNLVDKDWPAYHYRVTITSKLHDGTMTVPFSTGHGWHDAPELADVLETLASDASSVHFAPEWRDWAGEMGFDEDDCFMDDEEEMSVAQRTFDTIQRQSDELKNLLGEEAFKALLLNIDL